MSNLKLLPEWQGALSEVTPEAVYQNRREFIKLMGFAGLSLAEMLFPNSALAGYRWYDPFSWFEANDTQEKKFPAIQGVKTNTLFSAERSLTDEEVALEYNNFYEFSDSKDVWKRVNRFKTKPWQIEVVGHINKPMILDLDDLYHEFNQEQRIYRHRCVEAWAMVVPWIGFPLAELIQRAEPNRKAKYLRFVGFIDPASADGQRSPDLPWPYTEGLTLDEGMNTLAFLATGIYGHVLPAQHGAPVRLVLPWKYGFKSIKSITRIEFVEQRPATFWNTVVPHEYSFQANVNPDQPHPRWSQKREKMIGTGDVHRTLKYNGYGPWVSGLYSG